MRAIGLARSVAVGAFALWVLAGSLTIAPAWAARLREDLNGFNGYTWGSPPANYAALQRLKDGESADPGGKFRVYEKPGEVLTLNGVLLTKIRYRFFGEELESIWLSYEGRDNRGKLLQWLEESYGRLSPVERRMPGQIEWVGDKTEVTLSYDLVTQKGQLLFISRALRARLFDLNLGGGGMP